MIGIVVACRMDNRVRMGVGLFLSSVLQESRRETLLIMDIQEGGSTHDKKIRLMWSYNGSRARGSHMLMNEMHRPDDRKNSVTLRTEGKVFQKRQGWVSYLQNILKVKKSHKAFTIDRNFVAI